MADESTDNINPGFFEDAGVPSAKETVTENDDEPSYKVMGDMKIPVSKFHGKLWEQRIKSSQARMKPFCDAWDETIRYYLNDQLGHRVSTGDYGPDISGNRYYAQRRNASWTETENIVYSNINAMVPATYAKNPTAEFTALDDTKKQFCKDIEDLINKCAALDHAPGVSMKPKAKQAVVLALLTDLAWGEVGYIFKQDSSEQALQDLNRISKEYEKATSTKEIRELEGQIMAIESLFDFVSPEGLTFSLHRPHDILIDPDSVSPDYSDALWMASSVMIPTNYLNARYGVKGEDGQVHSIYAPTHVLAGSGDKDTSDTDLMVRNFRLISSDTDNYATQGYKSREEYLAACRTQVYFIWDRVTRLVYMYHSKDFKWPIWVYSDPYKLPRFFPFRPLSFHMPPVGNLSKGEVTYYLDQQDALNEMNDEERRMRDHYKNNVLYDSSTNVAREDIERWLRGPSGTAVGIRPPDGKKLDEMILRPPFPMKDVPALFNKDAKLQAIDRIAGVGDVIRGVQFKTNTTNQAIESYQASTQLRLDEKIDAIEDWIGGIYGDMAFIALQFMPQTLVQRVCGDAIAQRWKNMQAEEIEGNYEMRVVGGSSQKPTSSAKKQQAIEVGRVLGQFAKAAPRSVATITLKMFEEAFNEVDISDEEWAALNQEANATINGAMGGGGADGGPPAGAGGPDIQQVAQLIDQLPPQAKQALGQALARGVPIMQALQEIVQAIRGTQGSAAAPQGVPPQNAPAPATRQ